jgi:hypothetical protein
MAKGSPVVSHDEDKWRRENDYRTVCEAEEIRQDKRRMKGVAQHHRQMSKSHAAVGRTLKGRR